MFNILKNIPDPEYFKEEFPLTEELKKIKLNRDKEIKDVFVGNDNRFILIIGPCSADDSDAVCEYVYKLAAIQDKVKDKIILIPRIYTNKPRTNGLGYKGMLHQPNPAKAVDIVKGITKIRKMHIKAISESHLTAADEMLYPENLVYCDDLLSYHAIGARSTENQHHRLCASGLDAPVGMKNPMSGDFSVMFNSVYAAQSSHIFMFRQQEVETTGNPLSHVILRGHVNKHGDNIPNYHFEDLIRVNDTYKRNELLNPAIIVDLNHSNSGKIYKEQIRIAKEIIYSRNYSSDLKQIIKGFMIESYLIEGSTSILDNVYGKSITDPCLGFEDSERLIYDIAEKI